MKISEAIEQQLPYLRRYGRGVLGSAALGDRAVEAMLEDLLGNLPDAIDRPSLFKLLDRTFERLPRLIDAQNTGVQGISPQPRRALLLTAMEGFNTAEAGMVLGVSAARVDELLDSAEVELSDMLKSRIFIIEDEPLIAASLSQLVKSLGHSIAGIAVTRDQAVQAVLETRPDLILADIQLADGSQGTEAVKEIWSEFSVPVVFITAFPERMLTGSPGEPAFLIPKPFKPAQVKAVVTQALFIQSMRQN
ncbi:response regulator [Hyphomonas neptunium ATCC 15444]|uniref:Response regulator n=3 Tax=Hyphomonadaceae TaxID=69657 RepID=Q0BXN2_HYPNA|nr:response regulator [Hyphomonas neptunium ATCC 15444]KCZ93547.1 two-component response regulator [Hyphomonas hirschiana VP5]